MQNTCLRSITGAYKATNTKVLEAESGVIPLDLHLDQTVLRSRAIPRCSNTIELAKASIRRKLRSQRGRESQSSTTPMALKDGWTKREIEGLPTVVDTARGNRQTLSSTLISSGMLAKTWAKPKWDESWRRCLDTVPAPRKTPARDSGLHTLVRNCTGVYEKRKARWQFSSVLKKWPLQRFCTSAKSRGVLSPACANAG